MCLSVFESSSRVEEEEETEKEEKSIKGNQHIHTQHQPCGLIYLLKTTHNQ